jgi:mono/diheme cytochrome c family protein
VVLGCGAALAAAPDAARGRALYERHCESCHTPGIHARREQLPVTRDELRMLVDTFRRQANLGLTRDEIEDIVEYLNRTRYHFAPDRTR